MLEELGGGGSQNNVKSQTYHYPSSIDICVVHLWMGKYLVCEYLVEWVSGGTPHDRMHFRLAQGVQGFFSLSALHWPLDVRLQDLRKNLFQGSAAESETSYFAGSGAVTLGQIRLTPFAY